MRTEVVEDIERSNRLKKLEKLKAELEAEAEQFEKFTEEEKKDPITKYDEAKFKHDDELAKVLIQIEDEEAKQQS